MSVVSLVLAPWFVRVWDLEVGGQVSSLAGWIARLFG
jgi:hypothetical protein